MAVNSLQINKQANINPLSLQLRIPKRAKADQVALDSSMKERRRQLRVAVLDKTLPSVAVPRLAWRATRTGDRGPEQERPLFQVYNTVVVPSLEPPTGKLLKNGIVFISYVHVASALCRPNRSTSAVPSKKEHQLRESLVKTHYHRCSALTEEHLEALSIRERKTVH